MFASIPLHKRVMVIITLFLLSMLLGASSVSFAADTIPWGIDFEKGAPTLTLTCDGGHTVAREYRGTSGERGTPYVGGTVSVGGKVKYYSFTLDEGAFSREVVSYVRNANDSLDVISTKDRNAMVGNDSPNLFAYFSIFSKSDCH